MDGPVTTPASAWGDPGVCRSLSPANLARVVRTGGCDGHVFRRRLQKSPRGTVE